MYVTSQIRQEENQYSPERKISQVGTVYVYLILTISANTQSVYVSNRCFANW